MIALANAVLTNGPYTAGHRWCAGIAIGPGSSMTTHYASYLVRSWRAPDGARRVVVEHVQSGERAAVPTLDAVVERIVAWEAESPEGGSSAPDGGLAGDQEDDAPAGRA